MPPQKTEWCLIGFIGGLSRGAAVLNNSSFSNPGSNLLGEVGAMDTISYVKSVDKPNFSTHPPMSTKPVSTRLDATAIQMTEIHTVPPSLRVEIINSFDSRLAAKVAFAWGNVAEIKYAEAKKEREKGQFYLCEIVSRRIGSIISSNQNRIDEVEVYVCKDEEGNYQAMMALEIHTEHVKISYLVTNPINIRSSVNGSETKKVAGAGTTLLKKAEEIAIENGKSAITLSPLGSSVFFYKRNGFVSEGFDMRKTVQKIDSQITPRLNVA